MHPTIDPFEPISARGGRFGSVAGKNRYCEQRARRSQIRASIRRLLAKDGCQGVTVRGIAHASNSAVQTIYNLVGPRDQAISEAISEYSIHIGRITSQSLNTPIAIPAIANIWADVTLNHPDYFRQCNMIAYGDMRHIYYQFRDRQVRGMTTLLRQQKEAGILRATCDIADLAEDMVLLASTMWLDWADRRMPFDSLRRKLNAGFVNLLANQLSAEHAEVVISHLTVFGSRQSSEAVLPLMANGNAAAP